MKTKIISILMAMTFLLSFSACGSSDDDYGLRITAIAPFVDDDVAQDYADTLSVGDGLSVSVVTSSITATSTIGDSGDSVTDASISLASSTSIMAIATQVAASEIDIIICDYDNGSYFTNVEYFMSLDELFTEDELSAIDSSLFVSYDVTDDDGNATGETLDNYAIDVTSVSELSEFISGEQLVLHVVANAKNLDEVKEYILSLVA